MSSDKPVPAEETSDWERLGGRLKATRVYLGLSQGEVAERTGIPRTAVSELENGKRKVDTMELKKLAGLYRLSTSYFLDEDEFADAGEHALAGLARTRQGLTEQDRIAVARYIHMLKAQRRAEEEEARAHDHNCVPRESARP